MTIHNRHRYLYWSGSTLLDTLEVFLDFLEKKETFEKGQQTSTKKHPACKGALEIRRVFVLVDMIIKTKFSNCLNVIKIGLFP